MIRLTALIIVSMAVVFSAACTGEVKTNPPQNTNNVSVPATNVTADKQPAYDRMKDVSYSNAVAYLQESMEKENAKATPEAKLNTGKAFLLLLKVLKERYQQYGPTGFEVIGFSPDEFDTYKNVARIKLTEASDDKSASDAVRSEAKARLGELETLTLK